MGTKEGFSQITEEIFDIVDGNDRIIRGGQVPRSVAHAQKLLHRSITVLIFEDATMQRMAIQKRSMKKDVKPGVLDVLGGHLTRQGKYPDRYDRAARRELREEMFHGQKRLPKGLKLEPLFKLRKDTDEDPEFKVVYRLIHPGPFTADPEEVDDWYFQDVVELEKDMADNPEKYSETPVMLLKEYRRRITGVLTGQK